MKNKRILILLAALLLLSIACALPNAISGLAGGNKTTSIETMWTDVPVMDGLTKANIDLPLPAKLAFQGLIKSSSKGDAALDFISYTTQKQPKDIYDFYTLDKMTPQGWTMKDQPGCQGDMNGTTNAGVCFFGKENSGGTGSFLVIFVAGDSKTKETSVFFIRADAKNLPTQQP